MNEELDKVLDDEKRDEMIKRIYDLCDEGILKIRDWLAIYDIFINACQRGAAEAYEQFVMDSLKEGDQE